MSDVISQLVVKQTLLVELIVPPGVVSPGNVYKWPSAFLQKITGKMVYGVELVTDTQLTRSPSGAVVLPAADAANIVVTLVEQASNLKFVQEMPGTRLIPSLYNGYTQFLRPRMIDFTQCEVKVTDAGTIAAGQSILLNTYYRDANKAELAKYGRK